MEVKLRGARSCAPGAGFAVLSAQRKNASTLCWGTQGTGTAGKQVTGDIKQSDGAHEGGIPGSEN